MDPREKEILHVLLKDFEIRRMEVQAAEARHEKTSLWLSSGLLVALAACFKEDFKIGLVFLPLVIIAFWAHRLYNHTLHIDTLVEWLKRIEELVDKILKTKGLLDCERHFFRLRFQQASRKTTYLKLLSPHYVCELLLLLPSIVVYGVAVILAPRALSESGPFQMNLAWASLLVWGVYVFLFLVIAGVVVWILKTGYILREARAKSVREVYESIQSIQVSEGSTGAIDRDSCDPDTTPPSPGHP